MRWEKAPLVWGKRAFAPLFLFAEGFSTYYLYASAAGARFDKKSGTLTLFPPFFLAQFVKRVEKGGKGNAHEGARKKPSCQPLRNQRFFLKEKERRLICPKKEEQKQKHLHHFLLFTSPLYPRPRKGATISVGDPLPSPLLPQRTSHHLFLFSRVVLICPPKLREPLHHNFFWVLFRGWKESGKSE